MRKTLKIWILLICSYNALGQTIFSNEYIHTVAINIPGDNYDEQLIKNYEKSQKSGNHQYIKAQVIIDDVKLPDIGVRYKGASSFKASLKKKSLKLDFNEFVKGQRFQGLRKINLHNSIPDPSMLRDAIAYDLFNEFGVKAPRLSFARVYINDEYLGLYQLVEQVDKSFTKNTLFKNISWDGFKYLGRDIQNYRGRLDQKGKIDTTAWNHMFDLLQLVYKEEGLSFREKLSELLDVDLFLKALVVYTSLNNYDSIISSGRNFYLSFNDKSREFTWIPWDNAYALGASFYASSGDSNLEAAFCAEKIADGKVILRDTSKYKSFVHTSWTLSDGNVSSGKQIVYEFQRNRRFEACLTLSNISGQVDTECKQFRPRRIDGVCPEKLTSYDKNHLPVYGEMSESKLIQKVMKDEVLRRRYEELMCTFLNTTTSSESIKVIIDKYSSLISEFVYTDPNLLYPLEFYKVEVENLKSPFNLLNLIEERISYLRNQINCK